LNPSIADLRVCIVRRTIRLLEDIDCFEKAVKVHTELMISKSEARVRSNMALQRKRLLVRALGKDDFEDFDLDSDDSEELSYLREPTKDDLVKLLNTAAADPSRREEVFRVNSELQALEEKLSKEEAAAVDLHAEIQVAKARLGAEVAENHLWAEWVHSAVTQETDKPGQGPLSRIGRRQAALDEANVRLKSVLLEVQREAEQQFRKSAAASEENPDTDQRKVSWVPATAVSPSNLAVAVEKLDRQAQRAVHRAAQCLHGPASTLVSTPPRDWAGTCREISEAELDLQRLRSRQRLQSSTPTPSSFNQRRGQSLALDSPRNTPTPSTPMRWASVASVRSGFFRETPSPFSSSGRGQFVRPPTFWKRGQDRDSLAASDSQAGSFAALDSRAGSIAALGSRARSLSVLEYQAGNPEA
jgi:hypothetical protein